MVKVQGSRVQGSRVKLCGRLKAVRVKDNPGQRISRNDLEKVNVVPVGPRNSRGFPFGKRRAGTRE